MDPVARQALEILVARGERASARPSSRTITLVFTASGFSSYFDIQSRAVKDEVHATLREAERNGAITIEWDPLAGENGQVKRLKLTDTTALAIFLGRVPHQKAIRDAEEQLTPWALNPRVNEVLQTWRGLHKVRGRGVETLPDLIDALRVLEYCQQRSGEDIAVRALSAALFRSSKRLEELVSWLDILTCGTLQGSGRSAEEVFAGLGLVKHPPAVFIAGPASLTLRDSTIVTIPQPFLGLAPRSIETVSLPDAVRTILSVENLTVFHELATGRGGPLDQTLVVYTAGMPAPSFLDFYRALVHQAIVRKVLHWGDIDPGGFRIAGILARAAQEAGNRLRLWHMCADEFDTALSYRRLTTPELTSMRGLCETHGWPREARALAERPYGFEQEALPLVLPSAAPDSKPTAT